MCVSVFSQICVFVVYMGIDSGIVFINMHFETRFQKFAFSGCQNIVNVHNAKKKNVSLLFKNGIV